MSIEIEKTPLNGVLIIRPKIYHDGRGYFTESYNEAEWRNKGLSMAFVQENQSLSLKGTVRGLHYQKPPFAQGKLVRVLKGSALDVVVDIRKDSSTYGKHFSIELNEENLTQLYAPEGFAHGFYTLAENTIFIYKCTNFYNPDSEAGIAWDDEELAINWGIDNPVLSEKDRKNQSFKNFNSPFK
jgi:dTDP-4-dehydrorhamnose 3,5-epimerase